MGDIRNPMEVIMELDMGVVVVMVVVVVVMVVAVVIIAVVISLMDAVITGITIIIKVTEEAAVMAKAVMDLQITRAVTGEATIIIIKEGIITIITNLDTIITNLNILVIFPNSTIMMGNLMMISLCRDSLKNHLKSQFILMLEKHST